MTHRTIANGSQVRSQTDRNTDRKTIAIRSQTDRSNRYINSYSYSSSKDLPYGDQLPDSAGHVARPLTSTVQVSNSTPASQRACARDQHGEAQSE